MRTFNAFLVLACVVALTGGAAAPDIIPMRRTPPDSIPTPNFPWSSTPGAKPSTPIPWWDVLLTGQRHIYKDMRVDPGKLAKTHFVFVLQGTDIIEITKETPIRAYLFRTRIYAVPIEKKAEAKAAVAKLDKVIRPWPRRVERPRLPNIPSSELLESREYAFAGNPIHTIEIRYKLTGIAKDKLVVEKTRRLLDKKGKELKTKNLKKARQSYAALLGLVGTVGVLGLGFVGSRRDRADA